MINIYFLTIFSKKKQYRKIINSKFFTNSNATEKTKKKNNLTFKLLKKNFKSLSNKWFSLSLIIFYYKYYLYSVPLIVSDK